MGDRTRKLVALRARTDDDLLVLVQRELKAGFALLEAATARNSPLYCKAEKALSTATTLLARISVLRQEDRLRIESEANALRSRLDLVPAYAQPISAKAAS